MGRRKTAPQRFVVLREESNGRVSTLGPTGDSFEAFDEADIEARKLMLQFPHQNFFVAQTIRRYGHVLQACAVALAPEPKTTIQPILSVVERKKATK